MLIALLTFSFAHASLPRTTNVDDIPVIGGGECKCPNGGNCDAACDNAQWARCTKKVTFEASCTEHCGGSHGCGPRREGRNCGGCDTSAGSECSP